MADVTPDPNIIERLEIALTWVPSRRYRDAAQRDLASVAADLEAARAALRDVKAWLQQEEEVGLGVPDILWDVILAALAAPDPGGSW